MSYKGTIRKQTMPLKDSIWTERLNLRHEVFLSCGIFITMPAADPVVLEQRREGGGGGGKLFCLPYQLFFICDFFFFNPE